jgi:hypothetical protein
MNLIQKSGKKDKNILIDQLSQQKPKVFYTDLLVETELREIIYKITNIDIIKDL